MRVYVTTHRPIHQSVQLLSACPLMDQRVEIYGTGIELSGRCGIVTDWCEMVNRYEVELDESESERVYCPPSTLCKEGELSSVADEGAEDTPPPTDGQ